MNHPSDRNHRFEPKWYQGINRGQWLAMLAAFLGWMFDGFEMGLYPLVARPAVKEMLQDEVRAELGSNVSEATFTSELEERVGRWYAIFTALFLFGAAAGGLVFGWLGDRIGRTRSMIYSVLAYALFTGVGGFATAPWQLAAARFIAALGMGGEWALGVALVMELWPARARPVLAGLIGSAANFGFLVIALISLGLSQVLREAPGAWRWLMFVGVLPAFLTLFIRMFVPESEKWKQAVADAPKPSVAELMSDRLRARTLVAIGLCGVALLGTWGVLLWQNLWVEKLVEQSAAPHDDPKATKQKAAEAKNLTQICSSAGACAGTFLAGIVAAGLRRRTGYLLLCILALASIWWLFRPAWLFDPLVQAGLLPSESGRASYGGPFLLSTALAGFTTASFYGYFPLYLPELFPTRVRAMGQGISYNFGRIVAALGTLFATDPLRDAFAGDYAQAVSVVAFIYVVGMILIWLAPETHGRPLPD